MKKNVLSTVLLSFFLGGNVVFAQQEQSNNEEEKSLSIGVCGEVNASMRNYTGDRFDYSDKSSAVAQIPCFDVYMEYQFNPRWTLNAEAEFVSGCGIQLDEISLTRKLFPALNIKGGLLQLPIGHANSGYGYTDYFTTGDPEGEYAFLYGPMAEVGLALLGELNCGLDYHLSLTTGMNGAYASPYYWMQGATQGFFNDDLYLSSPALTFKLGYTGIDGLSVNAGIYHCSNIAKNSASFLDYEATADYKKVPTTIWFADGAYEHDYFTIRGSYLQGHLGGSSQYSAFLNTLDEEETECSEGTLAKGVITYMGELGLNLKNCFYPESNGPDLIPFVHYEYYNSQHELDGDDVIAGSKVNLWSFGCNWKANDNIAVKLNYTTRKIDDGAQKNMNEFNIGVAYDFEL